MACCESFSKVLLIVFNTLFFIIGAVILGVGIWVKVDKSNLFEVIRKISLDNSTIPYADSKNSTLDAIAIVLIVLGAVTFVIGFCGCCGAIRESSCLLYTYSALVGIIIIAEVGIGIYAGVEQKNFTGKISSELLKFLKAEFNGILSTAPSSFTQVFTAIMLELRCCGINGENDFQNTAQKWKQGSQVHPVGCCVIKGNVKYDTSKKFDFNSYKDKMETPNCPEVTDAKVYDEGCVHKIIELIKSNLAIIIGACIGLGLFEILCIVFACCVAHKND